MPPREAFAPRTRPVHYVLRLSLFPERKIVRSLLVALTVQISGALAGVVQGTPGKDSVMMILVVLLDIEIDGTVGNVGIARVQNLLDGLDLLDYVTRSPWLD